MLLGPVAGQLHESTERVRQPHLLDRSAVDLEQPRRAHQVRQALRPRDRHVQPVAREQELEPARGDVVPTRARHRARATFEPILATIEPRARRQRAPDHRLPRLLHLLEGVTEITSREQMDRVFRWCFSLQRTTLTFRRWLNDPEGSRLIEASKNPTDFDHNTALLEVATLLENAGLGSELVPRRPNEKTPDLNLRLSGTHLIEVEAKTPRACGSRQANPSQSTIRRRVTRLEARGQTPPGSSRPTAFSLLPATSGSVASTSTRPQRLRS